MSQVSFSIPFGRTRLSSSIPQERLNGVFESHVNDYSPEATESQLVERALCAPIGSIPLAELARKAKTATIIASDHTRPVPSKVIFPPLLKMLRNANPALDITILIATGCHRGTMVEELEGKFGPEIVKNEKIVIHDCRDESQLRSIGILPSGAELKINRTALDCDLLLSEGFIEPHFFAGFSGGRKSILPGIAAAKTVMGNHCSKFIASPFARAGILENNPLHRDMLAAAKMAKLRFIVNVVINAEKKVIYAVAGDPESAHAKGCEFLRSLCGVTAPAADVVITSNGGYPLDQNIYQSVKGMSAGETLCRDNGVIIMVSSCSDGHGGESFFRQLSEAASPRTLLQAIEAVPQDQTVADQWEAQILARILSRCRVIMVSEPSAKNLIEKMHMRYASTLEEALAMADQLNGNSAKITVIPDGVSIVAARA